MSGAADALVVGAGPAGAALAALLAGAGRSVVVLEREPGGRDTVCGGFLGEGALRGLEGLGVDPAALGALPLDRVRLAAGRGRAAEARLPFRAMSLSRRVLDAALQDRAMAAGAELRRGARAAALTREGGLWRARLAGGDTVTARAAFLATGKHDLRGWSRAAAAGSGLIGFRMAWRLTAVEAAALAGAVELHLFPGGYAGLEPVEGGRANLCLLVARDRLAAAGGGWESLLAALRRDAPALGARLDGARPCSDRPLSVAGLPFGFVHGRAAGAQAGETPWRLGDQAAVIPSFTGDGIGIALHSAQLAAACCLAGEDAATFHRRLAADAAGPVRRALALAGLMLRPGLQPALAAGARALPGLMRLCAARTRLLAGPATGLTRA
jgi:flavin-dependent dehydrogenase